MERKKPGLGRIPVGVAGAAAEGFGLPGDLLSSLQSVTGLPANQGIFGSLPTSQQIREKFVEPIAEATVGKEYLQPQSFGEEVLQKTAKNLPLTAITGGLSGVGRAAGSIGRDLVSSTAMTAAERAHLPPVVQALAGFGAERGANKLFNMISGGKVSANTLRSLAQEAKNKAYGQVEELGSKIKVPATAYKKNLEGMFDKIYADTRLSEIERNRLVRDLDQYVGDITQNSAKASDLVKRRTELNDIIKGEKGVTKNYYQAIRQPLNDLLKKEGSTHRDFSKALETADAIHRAQNFGSSFLESVDEFPTIKKVLKSPLAYSVASLGPSYFFKGDPFASLGLAGATYAGAKTLSKASEIAGFLANGKEPAKVLLQASEHLLKRNIPAAIRSYNKLNSMASKYEKDTMALEKRREDRRKKSTAHLIPL